MWTDVYCLRRYQPDFTFPTWNLLLSLSLWIKFTIFCLLGFSSGIELITNNWHFSTNLLWNLLSSIAIVFLQILLSFQVDLYSVSLLFAFLFKKTLTNFILILTTKLMDFRSFFCLSNSKTNFIFFLNKQNFCWRSKFKSSIQAWGWWRFFWKKMQ